MLTLSHLQMHFDVSELAADNYFENIVAKEEIAHNEQFIILSKWYQLYSYFYFRRFLHFCPEILK